MFCPSPASLLGVADEEMKDVQTPIVRKPASAHVSCTSSLGNVQKVVHVARSSLSNPSQGN